MIQPGLFGIASHLLTVRKLWGTFEHLPQKRGQSFGGHPLGHLQKQRGKAFYEDRYLDREFGGEITTTIIGRYAAAHPSECR